MARKQASKRKVSKKRATKPAPQRPSRSSKSAPSHKVTIKHRNSWSHSSWNTWRNCPRQYMHKTVQKIWDPEQRKYLPAFPEAPSRAMERGIEIHLKMEHYLKGNIQGIPRELEKIETELRNMKRFGALAEESWTLTKDLDKCEPTDWNRAWLRAKIDAHLYFEEDRELVVVDLKTGRIKPYESQKELYAWVGSLYYPKAESIRVELLYSDHEGKDGVNPDASDYSAKECKSLGRKWIERADRMLADREYPMKPGSACDMCSFRSNIKMPDGRPGPCDGWKRR